MELTTPYLGHHLSSPIVIGASPMTDGLDTARRAEDAGAGAVVMRSLFEEQITCESQATQRATESHSESFPEALTHLPDPADFVLGPQDVLHQVSALRDALGIPVMASLNGVSPGGWLRYARAFEQAGAQGLELNLYDVVVDPQRSAQEVEDAAVATVATVCRAVGIPVAVKLSPFHTAPLHFVQRLSAAGAQGVVLFNRFFAPDVDIEELEVRPRLDLSQPHELGLRLRWLALLSGRLPVDLAASGGVHDVDDVVKALMCGADVVQVVSTVLRHGVGRITALRDGLQVWLTTHEYDSLAQLRGSLSWPRCPDPSAYARANYIQLLQTWRPNWHA